MFTQATSKAGKNGSSTVSQKDSTGRTIETEFDKAGNVVSKKITATDKSTVTTTYNAKGNPKKTTYSNGNEINYEYDSKNKLTKQTLNRANGTKKVTEYTEEAVKNEDGTTSSPKNKITTVTEYDTNNNQKSKTVTGKNSDNNTVITVFDANDDIDRALDALMSNKNLALGFSLQENIAHTAKQTNGSIYKYEGINHAFSITNVTKNSVTFVNPWESETEITMTRAEFKKLGVSGLQGCDLKNLDTNNIKLVGTLDKESVKKLINNNSDAFVEIFNFFDSGNKITKEQRFEIMNELKSKLSNGKTISDITSFVNTYAASKKLDNASKTAITNSLKALSGGNTLSKKDIANGLLGVVIAGDGAKNSENLKPILNKLQTSSDISTLAENINETGISSYNITDITTLLKAVGGSNNKIDNNEYTKLANTIFNNS